MEDKLGKYFPYIIYLPQSQLKNFGKSYDVPLNFKTLKNKKDIKVFLTKTQIKKLDKAKKNKKKVDLKFSKSQLKSTFEHIKKVNFLDNKIKLNGSSKNYIYDPGTGELTKKSMVHKETKRCLTALEKEKANKKKLQEKLDASKKEHAKCKNLAKKFMTLKKENEKQLKSLKKENEKCKKLEERLKALREKKEKEKEAVKIRKKAEKIRKQKDKEAEKLGKQNLENVEEIKAFNENMKLIDKVKNMEFLRDYKGVKLTPAQENFIKEARKKKNEIFKPRSWSF